MRRLSHSLLPTLALLVVGCSGAPASKTDEPLVAEEVAPPPPSGPTVRTVSAGGEHTCAITSEGFVGWGRRPVSDYRY